MTHLAAPLESSEVRAGTIPGLFAAVAATHPERPAVLVVEDDAVREVSYAELADLAGGFAAALRAVRPESATSSEPPRVGLHLPHGLPMIAAQLGALAAGWCYVPLDPTYPVARLRLMREVAALDVVIAPRAQRALADEVPLMDSDAVSPAAYDVADLDPSAPAYLLFTSGSTGTPKAVVHSHRSVLHGIANHLTNMALGPDDRVSLLTSFSFDMAVSDLYGALLAGAASVPLDLRAIGLPATADGVRRAGVTVFHATPTVFRLLSAHTDDQPASTVRLAILGGEAVHREDVATARASFSPNCVLVNGYGFTEASFIVQHHVHPHDEVDDEQAVLPIGHALPGFDVRVEGANADGVGELVVTSDVLAQGYWGDDEQTRERFSDDLRTYRPGDLVRQLPDGSLSFAGRSDRQVKVRGVRVELDEVQLALEQRPEVARAVVLPIEAGPETQVQAFVQPTPSATVTESGLRSGLREQLPDAMVPDRCHVAETLPLTPTGKVDVRSLHAVALEHAEMSAMVGTVTETPQQSVVLEAWVAAIGDPGGLDVSFFDAGGSSIALARLHQHLSSQISESPSPAKLLGAGTVRAMALLLPGALSPAASGPGATVTANDAAARAAARRQRRDRRGSRA